MDTTVDEQPGRGAGFPPCVLLVAAAGGFGVMAVELAAVRLIAPWFGTSLPVWTNVIGVVLLALSMGYLLGARLSTRARPLRSLGAVLIAAAVLVAWSPALARPVAELFRPANLPLHDAAPHFVWGSLAASLVLFLPGSALLGAVGPLCVEALQRATGLHAGTAGGRVLFASTLASLAGCFATSHVLVPQLGVSATFILGGAVLATAGLLALVLAGAERRKGDLLLVLLFVGPNLASTGARLELPNFPGEDTELLAVEQSPYQWLYVVEQGPSEDPLRLLKVNEGVDSFQSVWRPREGLLGGGLYYDLFALPAWWTPRATAHRVAVLGFGAGTTARVLRGAVPPHTTLRVSGIEIDPVAVALGQRWFDLAPGDDLVVAAGLDGRAGMRLLREPQDLVVLDAYANQVEIPPHLSTVELFEEVHACLAPGGTLAVNVSGFGLDDPVVSALAATVAQAFGARALVVHVPFGRNYVVFARRDADVPEPGSAAWLAAGPAAHLAHSTSLAGAWRWFTATDGTVLDDDVNPIDVLQQRSLREGRARLLGAPAPPPGADLAALAAERMEHGHYRLALAAIEAGLAADPADLVLAWRRCICLAALGDAADLEAATLALARSTDELAADDPDREAWLTAVEEQRGLVEERAKAEGDRAASLRRAQRSSIGLLGLAALLLGGLALASGKVQQT